VPSHPHAEMRDRTPDGRFRFQLRTGMDIFYRRPAEDMFYIPKDKALHDKPWVSQGNKDITYEFAGPNMIVGRWINGNHPGRGTNVWYNICTKHAYSVKSPKMNTLYSENALLKLNKKTR